VTRPELHRPVRVSRIGHDGAEVVVEADEVERTALAARMGIPGITALRCAYALRRHGRGVVEASGRLEAVVVQTCVLSLEDFAATIGEAFRLDFVPAGAESDDPDPESVDEVPYEGDTIDLGEATAEQLALSLDPYPRRPGALLPEAAATEFDDRLAGLEALRDGKGPGRGGLQ
jgi:uncharacterized metal-binding protein YceD (DUF177 family)